jgi:Flp pilus assembly protein TadG
MGGSIEPCALGLAIRPVLIDTYPKKSAGCRRVRLPAQTGIEDEMVRFWRKIAGERGQALVETALAVPILLILVLGMVDLGKAYNYSNDLTHLANEAARYATVDNCGTGCASIENQVKSDAETKELRTNATITICFPAPYTVGTPVSAGQRVTGKASVPYHFLPTLVAWVGLPTTKTLTASATEYLEHDYNPGAAHYVAQQC